MSARVRLGALSLALSLVGCSLVSNTKPTGILTPALLNPSITQQGVLGKDQQQGYGTIELTIAFPKRDYPGFKAQTIPLSTNTLGITVSQGQNTITQAIVTRQATSNTATASLQVPSGTNYTFDVKAYREGTYSLLGVVPGLAFL